MTHQAADALRQGNYSAAVQTYAQAGALAPPNSDEAASARAGQSQAFTAQGLDAAHANNLQAAQAAYLSAVQVNASNAAAWDNLGNVYWQQGDTPHALDAWEKAAAADPGSAYGKEAQQNAVRHYMDLAQGAAGSGNITQARIYWQKVTQIDPGSDDAFKAEQNISRTEPSATVPPGVGLPQ